jgi:hypothetical protein
MKDLWSSTPQSAEAQGWAGGPEVILQGALCKPSMLHEVPGLSHRCEEPAWPMSAFLALLKGKHSCLVDPWHTL